MILGPLEIDVHSTHFKANTSMATLPNSTWEPTNDSTKENERGEETNSEMIEQMEKTTQVRWKVFFFII